MGNSDYQSEDGVVAFVRHVLNIHPHDYQEDILRLVERSQWVVAPAPCGTGKTVMCAWLALWSAMTSPAPVTVAVVTSSYEWSFFITALYAAMGEVGESLPLPMTVRRGNIHLANGSLITEVSPVGELPDFASWRSTLFILHEAWRVSSPFFTIIEKAAGTTAGARILAIGTPLLKQDPQQPDTRLQHILNQGDDRWSVRPVTCEEGVAAGRLSEAWVKDSARRWGETSSLYRTRVLGEWA